MRHLKELMASISMEAAVLDGMAKQEKEYTFFARINDWAQFGTAQSTEQQEQWEFFCQPGDGNEGTVRIRAINNQRYVLCTKLKKPGEIGKAEAEMEVSADMFKHFRALAPKGTFRTRYVFPIPNSQNVWEIDVFKNAKGETVEWVKIDLEVQNESDPIPALPIAVVEKIIEQPSARSDEQKQIINDLFDNQYALGGSNRDSWIETANRIGVMNDPVADTTEEALAATTDTTALPPKVEDPVTDGDIAAATDAQTANSNAGEPQGDGSEELPTPVVPDGVAAPAPTDATAVDQTAAETGIDPANVDVVEGDDLTVPEPEVPADSAGAALQDEQTPALPADTTETESTEADPMASEPAAPTTPADPEAPPSDLSDPENPDNPANPDAPINLDEVPTLPEEDELDENGLPKIA